MTVETLRNDLQQGRQRLFTSVQGLTEEQFRHVPPGERWCVATHLAHVLRCDRLWAARVRAALAEDNPLVESTGVTNEDDPGLAQKLAVPQIVHGLQAVMRDLDDVLSSHNDRALQRSVRHERMESLTIEQMVAKTAAHEAEHADAIARIVRSLPATGRVIIPLSQRS